MRWKASQGLVWLKVDRLFDGRRPARLGSCDRRELTWVLRRRLAADRQVSAGGRRPQRPRFVPSRRRVAGDEPTGEGHHGAARRRPVVAVWLGGPGPAVRAPGPGGAGLPGPGAAGRAGPAAAGRRLGPGRWPLHGRRPGGVPRPGRHAGVRYRTFVLWTGVAATVWAV